MQGIIRFTANFILFFQDFILILYFKLGILYGLAKIHEPFTDNIPSFRPILSVIDAPTYKLATLFVSLLESLTNRQYTIRDSFCLFEELKNFDLSLIMSNFGLESLFTNIPLQKTIEFCAENLFDNKEYFHDISKEFFLELLTLTMNESFILFNNGYYRQLKME